MIVFSNCKINLGLNIVGKRADGYHNLETVFYPLPFYDVIELIESDNTTLTVFGNSIPGAVKDNIILKAYDLLQKDFPHISPVAFYLLKNIPIGAGLGAGSANGAMTLMALNETFNLQLSEQQLKDYALQLGSDCPFFIVNQSGFATGRGEVLTPVTLDLADYKIIIVNPGIHISTAAAFSHITPTHPIHSLEAFIHQPVTEWKDIINNDFEPGIFKLYPEIKNIKDQLYHAGAVFSLMSGSGSTVYGIFHKKDHPKLNFPENYFIKTIEAS